MASRAPVRHRSGKSPFIKSGKTLNLLQHEASENLSRSEDKSPKPRTGDQTRRQSTEHSRLPPRPKGELDDDYLEIPERFAEEYEPDPFTQLKLLSRSVSPNPGFKSKAKTPERKSTKQSPGPDRMGHVDLGSRIALDSEFVKRRNGTATPGRSPLPVVRRATADSAPMHTAPLTPSAAVPKDVSEILSPVPKAVLPTTGHDRKLNASQPSPNVILGHAQSQGKVAHRPLVTRSDNAIAEGKKVVTDMKPSKSSHDPAGQKVINEAEGVWSYQPSIEVLKGLLVRENGDIQDKSGNLMGVIVEGDPIDFVGLPLNKFGEVLDEDGDVIGRAAVLTQHLADPQFVIGPQAGTAASGESTVTQQGGVLEQAGGNGHEVQPVSDDGCSNDLRTSGLEVLTAGMVSVEASSEQVYLQIISGSEDILTQHTFEGDLNDVAIALDNHLMMLRHWACDLGQGSGAFSLMEQAHPYLAHLDRFTMKDILATLTELDRLLTVGSGVKNLRHVMKRLDLAIASLTSHPATYRNIIDKHLGHGPVTALRKQLTEIQSGLATGINRRSIDAMQETHILGLLGTRVPSVEVSQPSAAPAELSRRRSTPQNANHPAADGAAAAMSMDEFAEKLLQDNQILTRSHATLTEYFVERARSTGMSTPTQRM